MSYASTKGAQLVSAAVNRAIARGEEPIVEIPANPDLQVENHGSLFLLRPLSDEGESWIEEHLDHEEAQYWGRAIAVEPRYIGDIVAGAQGDGLRVV